MRSFSQDKGICSMMTQYIEFKEKPSDDDPSLIVEVNFDGDIISASGFVSIIDDWGDVLEFVKNSKHWVESINEEWSQLDWTEDLGDLESITEGLRPDESLN